MYYTTLLEAEPKPTYCHSVQNTFHPSDIWMDYNMRVRITILISRVWNLVRQVKERTRTDGEEYCRLGCDARVTNVSEKYSTSIFRVVTLAKDYQITCHINRKKIIFIVTTARNLSVTWI